jgi:hypothetical protein
VKKVTEQILEEKPHSIIQPIKKGNATLVLRLKNATWDEMVELVKHCQGNPEGCVVEVYVGNEVFDA